MTVENNIVSKLISDTLDHIMKTSKSHLDLIEYKNLDIIIRRRVELLDYDKIISILSKHIVFSSEE